MGDLSDPNTRLVSGRTEMLQHRQAVNSVQPVQRQQRRREAESALVARNDEKRNQLARKHQRERLIGQAREETEFAALERLIALDAASQGSSSYNDPANRKRPNYYGDSPEDSSRSKPSG